LLFPHHENEIAQSEGCHHKNFVRFWMHNNMIQFDGAKMSKSLGNVVKFRDFRNKYPPEVFKFLILSSHYRSVVDFSDTTLAQAVGGLAKIYSGLKMADEILDLASTQKAANQPLSKATIDALNDDFNTPIVMREVFESLGAFNQSAQAVIRNPAKLPELLNENLVQSAQKFSGFVRAVGKLMALFQEPPQQFLAELDDALLKVKGLEREKIEALVRQRQELREQKKYSEADRIRTVLDEMGITVHDYAAGSAKSSRVWELKK
jgi:cysteinyl-tRNA synthetase